MLQFLQKNMFLSLQLNYTTHYVYLHFEYIYNFNIMCPYLCSLSTVLVLDLKNTCMRLCSASFSLQWCKQLLNRNDLEQVHIYIQIMQTGTTLYEICNMFVALMLKTKAINICFSLGQTCK